MFCLVCGRLSHEYETCPDCRKTYYADIEAKRFPPGLTEQGQSRFSLAEWENVKRWEHSVKHKLMTPEEARKKFADMVKRLNYVHTETASEQAEREARENFRLY